MKIAIYLGLSVIATISIIYVIGIFMPAEHVAKRSVVIKAPLERVWRTVTDIANQAVWRSDLEEVKVMEDSETGLMWVERPERGRPIIFREKVKIPQSRYEIEIVPSGVFSGYWVGQFSEVEGGTRLESTEVGRIHNPVFRVLAYFFFDLEKTIKEYQEDLKDHLETNA